MYDPDAMLAGLGLLTEGRMLAFLLAGFLLGFVVGAIPGFNDANVMAILLPFTLLLTPEGAVVAMAAVYAGAQAAGSIPAILMNIPGTPGNAATTLEGYPLSRAGRSGFALGISFGASAVGALIGASLALTFAPMLGAFALSFGPAEMFMVGILGLTVVSTLAADNMARGLMIAGFGVLVSFIGADSMAAFPRATFGVPELYDGMPLIPVLLGLFGFSELIFLLGSRTIADDGTNAKSNLSEIAEGLRETVRHAVNLLRSSVLGFLVGVIPGAGATIGSFLAYGQARQWSRRREAFGKGNPEGLVATDAANNATACGAVVPMLTLGLPGSASTLVMLATLVLHGVRPGPQFFSTFEAEAYAILFSLFFSALLIAVLGMPLARYAQRITHIPNAVLVPLVTVLVFTGAYAWRFLAFDILLMIVFGIFGAILRVHRYPIPAFLLAIILGPILEANFLRATRIGGYDALFEGPIVLILLGATVLSLVAPILLSLRRNGRGEAGDGERGGEAL